MMEKQGLGKILTFTLDHRFNQRGEGESLTKHSVSHPPNCLLKIIEHYWSLQSGNDTKKPQEC